jgi:16S rRNA (cytidine1402-2'-O)-methyltransferase
VTGPDSRDTSLWRSAERLAPGLYIVATPIGNLRDISLRALSTLASCETVLAEDTRVSRNLLSHYGIATPLSAYHEHNAALVRPGIIARLQAGAALALISDAGTPLISDPGYKLVTAAIEAGVPVIPIPGASALLAALTVSGLPADRFFFEGFLPPKSAARRARIAELAAVPGTLVFYESPRRTAAALADLAAVLGPRDAVIARELTKHFETLRRGTLPALAAELAAEATPKGEIVLLVAPPGEAAAPQPANLDAALRAALAKFSVKDAVAIVAAETGAPRRALYARAVELAAKDDAR